MADPDSPAITVEALAEEFLQRRRRGERPRVAEYLERYPHLADEIRAFFPVLGLVEDFKPDTQDRSGGPDHSSALEPDRPLGRLGDYRILRQVGRGGMGVVFEAEQVSLGRHVALKVLPGHALLDPRYLQRFRREARAAARLHHSNIVPVYGVGEEGGLHYYVMQFIQGLGLDEVITELCRLRHPRGTDATPPPPPGTAAPPSAELSAADAARGLLMGSFPGSAPLTGKTSSPAASGVLSSSAIHLPGQDESSHLSESGRPYWQSVARIGAQVADALAYAHSQGVLHRDVKPANLMLDTQGTVWVTDFGLAKVAADEDHLTETGDVIGTVRYMAPEAFAGPGDARGDVYGLGLTLYELLTLRPAFEEKDRRRLLDNIMDGTLSPPRKLNPAVPRDLETIVLKAIARDPAQRYATSAELAEDLRRFLADRPIRARRVSLREQVWRWCRRNPVVATLGASVALLVVTVAVVSSVAAVRLEHEQGQTLAQLQRAEKAEQEALDRLWDARLAEAHALRWSGQPGRHFRSLESLAEAAKIHTSLQLRNEAVACLPLVDLRVEQRWACRSPGAEQNHGVTVDAALERYAVAVDKGEISIRRVADHQELCRLPSVAGWAGSLVFSPDGRFLTGRTHQWAVIWDVDAREVVIRIPIPNDDCIYAQAFSPDSRLVALGVSDATVSVWDLASRKEVGHLKTPARPESVAFHPRAPQLAVSSWGQKDVQVFSLESGQELYQLPHPEILCGVAWHPDGRLLAVAFGGQVQIWDAVARAQRAVLKGHTNRVMECTFNHGGDLLASRAWDGTTRLWDPASGNQLVAIEGHFIRFSRDDQRLAFAQDKYVGFWAVADGRLCRTLIAYAAADDGVQATDVSPDGRLLASTGEAGVRLWDLSRGKELALLPTGSSNLATFTPEGDGLITSGAHGVHRWPVDAARAGLLRVGPPRLLFGERRPRWHCALSRDGKWLAVITGPGQAAVLPTEGPGRKVLLEGHAGVSHLALSPDGRWATTGTQHGTGIKVWDARTGKVVKEIAAAGYGSGTFSPDGRRLVTGSWGHETCSWVVGSWQLERRWIPSGSGAFSNDGKLLVFGLTLVDPQTGVELATLTHPNPLGVSGLCFTPEGDRLLMGGESYHTIRVWDLATIRARLREMNLDWEAPAEAPAQPEAAPPLRVTVLPGDLPPHGRK
jgi:serine/threonine protein kinase/WD40 repeat protein